MAQTTWEIEMLTGFEKEMIRNLRENGYHADADALEERLTLKEKSRVIHMSPEGGRRLRRTTDRRAIVD